MAMGNGPYYDPQMYGLELVGTVDWTDEPYEFDMTAVWRDPQTGDLFYADDSGCSCPIPFEDVTRETMTGPVNRHDVLAHLVERNGGPLNTTLPERIAALPSGR